MNAARVNWHQHYRLRILCQCLFVLCVVVTPSTAMAQVRVRYPQPESLQDARASYPVALLQLCARQSGNQMVVTPSEFTAQQGRNIRQLAKGDGLEVIWAVADQAREKELLPIYIPIDRGLIGWRLLLIRAQDRSIFAAISSLSDLAPVTAGQGHDWPDVMVLRANNLDVATSPTYEGLFKMLALDHVKYFPRSLAEIWPEIDAHKNLNLVVQDSLALHYRSGLYFFVNKNNVALADTLTSCLHAVTRNGTLRALFNEYYGDAIAKSNLMHRTVIELEKTTFVSRASPLPPEYWFAPTELGK